MTLLFFAFEQILFFFCFKAILLALRFLLIAIVYSPQLITGYFLCRLFLNKTDSALLWVTAIILVACLIHFLILILKQIIISLKSSGNFLWIPLLLIALAYTCIFPAWIVFRPVEYCMSYISAERAVSLTWLFSTAFSIYLYFRYDFFNLRSAQSVVYW